jgi:hypothetical protein
MPGAAFFDLVPIPPELLPHRVTVQRGSVAGVDASGFPLTTWVDIYTDLPCLVAGQLGTASRRTTGGGGIHEDFEQVRIEQGYTLYLGSLPDGTMPDIKIRDRLLTGTWIDGTPRYLQVTGVVNELDMNVVMTVGALAWQPG